MAQDIRFDIFEDERESDMLEQIQQNLFGEKNAYDQDILIVDTELNGLSGFEVFYHGRNVCYEVWLSLPDNRRLTFFTECATGQANNVKEHPFIQRFLSDIRQEKQKKPAAPDILTLLLFCMRGTAHS